MIEKKLKYKFKDPRLLETALTHDSYAHEKMDRVRGLTNKRVESNERLEFLGDAILGFIVARILYHRFPEHSEGKLSKIRSALVSTTNFAHFARELKIDEHILLGKGEESTGGRGRQSNLAGAFEAVIGAVFIDGGYRKVSKVISKIIKDYLDGEQEIFKDYKTQLQEIAQKQHKKSPRYKVVLEEGPPHDKHYHVEVKLGRKRLGRGEGQSKKQAQQDAAKDGLEHLEDAQ